MKDKFWGFSEFCSFIQWQIDIIDDFFVCDLKILFLPMIENNFQDFFSWDNWRTLQYFYTIEWWNLQLFSCNQGINFLTILSQLFCNIFYGRLVKSSDRLPKFTTFLPVSDRIFFFLSQPTDQILRYFPATIDKTFDFSPLRKIK